MEEPRPGGTAFLITVTSTPGKYASRSRVSLLIGLDVESLVREKLEALRDVA